MVRVTLAQLEAFYWTVTLGSVEAAAQRLHLAQPSVSQRLKALQIQFNRALTERRGRGLQITSVGREVLRRADRILREVDLLAEDSEPTLLRGPVRIGMAEGLALVVLPCLVERLREAHPLMKLERSVGISANLEPRLHNHAMDLAFLVNPSEHEGFELVPLGKQETRWTACVNWTFPAQIRLADLMNVPSITSEPGSINYRQVKGWFAFAAQAPQREDTCNSVSILAHLVISGAAVGILPVRMAAPHVAWGKLTILNSIPPVPDTPIYAEFRTQGLEKPGRSVLATLNELLREPNYID